MILTIVAFLLKYSFLKWVGYALQFGLSVWVSLPKVVRQVLILAAVAAAIYLVGDVHGRGVVQKKWDDAKAIAVERGVEIGRKANDDAEKSVPALSPTDRAADADIAPRKPPCRVRDRFDRSCT